MSTLLESEECHEARTSLFLLIPFRAAQTTIEVQITSEPSRHLVLENVPSHHHDGPHLLVAITDLDIRSDVAGMGPMPGKSGDVKWLPGGYTHTLTNEGKSPARFVTVEF